MKNTFVNAEEKGKKSIHDPLAGRVVFEVIVSQAFPEISAHTYFNTCNGLQPSPVPLNEA